MCVQVKENPGVVPQTEPLGPVHTQGERGTRGKGLPTIYGKGSWLYHLSFRIVGKTAPYHGCDNEFLSWILCSNHIDRCFDQGSSPGEMGCSLLEKGHGRSYYFPQAALPSLSCHASLWEEVMSPSPCLWALTNGPSQGRSTVPVWNTGF